MPKKIKDISIPVYKDKSNKGQWANEVTALLSEVAEFFQGNPNGTEFGLKTHKFMINNATGKIALYELVSGNWTHKADFGSVITDRFVFTKPMGGIQFRHKDGYDYTGLRISPTGNGKGWACGGYAGPLILVSDVSGVMMAREKGPDFYRVLPAVNVTTNKVRSKRFSFPVKVTAPCVIYGGTAYVTPDNKDRKLICRHWIEDFHGTILHETVSAEHWALSNDPEELEKKLYAEYVTIPKNSGDVSLLASIPIGITDYKTAYDVKLCWEFKEELELLGTNADTIKYALEYEEGVLEKVASQEWVQPLIDAINANITSNSTEDRKRANHTGTQPANTIVQDANNRFVTDADKANWNGKANLADNNIFTGRQVIRSTTANSGENLMGFFATSDSKYRLAFDADGAISFTSGASNSDLVKLKYSSNGKLKIGDKPIIVEGDKWLVSDEDRANWDSKIGDVSGKANLTNNTFTGPQILRVETPSSLWTSFCLSVKVRTEVFYRFSILSDGSLLFSNGTSEARLNFKSAGLLQIDDKEIAFAHHGDTKRSFRSSDHNGWIILDGRAKATLTATQQAVATSFSWGANIPDTRGKLSMSAGGGFSHLTTGGSKTIAQSALPNVTLTATGQTTAGGGHDHTFTGQTDTTGAHTHSYAGNYGWNGNQHVGFSDKTTTETVKNVSTTGDHYHLFAGRTATTVAHNHSFVNGATSSINGGVTQTDHIPPYYALNEFVYLGL